MHRIAIVFAALLLSAPAFGQAPPPPPPPGGGAPTAGEQAGRGLIAKGIKGGVNFSTLVGDGADGTETRTGFGAGGFVVYGLGPTIAVQAKALYIQQGWTGNSEGTDLTVTYGYLQVPVLGRLTIQTGGQMKPYVFGGASLAVLVSGEVEGNGQSIDIKDDTASTDLGLVAGAGIEVPAGRGAVLGELRYTRGLLTVDPDGDFDAFNSVFSLLVGFGF